MTDFGFGRPAALTSLRELAFAATALRGCVFDRASRLTCKQVSLRRNSAALRCQHLAKVYDAAHPRAKRKKT